MKRIGLYGGSFDPVHLGHLLVAQAACEEQQLDRILFIPTAQSPFKPDREPAPGGQRLRRLRLALAGQPRCEVDGQELERGGISYTIDTVRNVASRDPDATYYYLIGADHVAQLPQWREATALARMVTFLVIPRPGQSPPSLPGPYHLCHLQGFPLAVSSSQIRARIRNGQSIAHLTPPQVAEAVRNNRLYL